LYFILNYLLFVGVIEDIRRISPSIGEVEDLIIKISLLPARNETKIEHEVFDLTNKERNAFGVSSLKYNTQLSQLAKDHSKDMQIRNYFLHETPEGLTPTDRAVQKGISVTKNFGSYIQTGIGENIMDIPITIIPILIISEDCFIVITNEQIASCTVDGWMKSPGHRANILNPSYDEIGVGTYCSFLGCKLTQDFR
jgi:uncharacterized protein YkwD